VTLAEYPATQIQIVGHTDSSGQLSFNEQLSRTRASAVSIYLGAKGIPSSRMQVEGMGPSMPIASNATTEGRAQNRRVEMKIVPVQG
jgi:outer membrane protein OmpA-like peptidoglycan-associated protein